MLVILPCVQVVDRLHSNHLREKQLHTLASEIEQDERSQLTAEARHVDSPHRRHTSRPADWLQGTQGTEDKRDEPTGGEDPCSTWYRLSQDSPGLSGEDFYVLNIEWCSQGPCLLCNLCQQYWCSSPQG